MRGSPIRAATATARTAPCSQRPADRRGSVRRSAARAEPELPHLQGLSDLCLCGHRAVSALRADWLLAHDLEGQLLDLRLVPGSVACDKRRAVAGRLQAAL